MSATSWVTIQTVYTQAFGVAVFALQAPLLGPRAFGLISIVMVFITLCDSLLDSATEVLISARDLEAAHYATMNGIAVLIGAGLSLTLLLGCGMLAVGFHEPQLAAVGRAMAMLPLLSALGCSPSAAAKRAMEFKPLAIRMISGVTVGGVAGVVLTLLGAGVWALVWQAIVQRFISVIVLWSNSSLPFQMRLSAQHWRQLSVFAGPMLIARSMTWVYTQLPRFILALHLSVAELGLFSLAARLSDILVQVAVVPRAAVARVELRKFDPGSLGLIAAFRQLLASMSFLCFGLSAVGAALLPTLIQVWLDPKWFAAIVPAQVLLLSSATWVALYAGGVLFLAVNQQRKEAWMSILQSSTILFAAWFFSSWGLVPVSAAMAIRPLLLIPVVAFLARRYCQIPTKVFLGAQLPALTVALIVGITAWILRIPAEKHMGSVAALALMGGGAMVIYVLTLRQFAPAAGHPFSLRRNI